MGISSSGYQDKGSTEAPTPRTLRSAFDKLDNIKQEIDRIIAVAGSLAGPFPPEGDAKVRPVAGNTVEELHDHLGNIHNRLSFARQSLETAHG